MTASVEGTGNGDGGQSRLIVEHRFRSARVNPKDLLAIAEGLGDITQHWLCSVPTEASVVEHVRQLKLSEWAAPTLEELVRIGPRGRVFHFELCAEAEWGKVRLTLGGHWSKTHRAVVTLTYRPDSDPAGAYATIVEILRIAAKRGRPTHYIWSVAVTGLLYGVGALWFFLFGMFTSEPGTSVAASALGASLMTAFIASALSPLWISGLRTLTASSVRLSASGVTHQIGAVARAGWRWIKYAYSPRGNLEYKTYLATHGGWIVGAIGVIVAMLAWLFPRG